MIYEKWGNMKYKYRNRQFWCRGYYVSTVGKQEKVIERYIENQLKEDATSGRGRVCKKKSVNMNQ